LKSPGAAARVAAARALAAVAFAGRSIDVALAEASGSSGLSSQDQALVQAIAYGSVRQFHALEPLAGRLLHRPLPPRDRDVLALIVTGLFQRRHLRLPDYAAIGATAEAARGLGKPWAAAVVNAVLRRDQREGEEIARRLAEHDEQAAYSHPRWLIDALRADWPAQWREVLEANNALPPMCLRVNRQRLSRDQYLQELAAAGIGAQPSTHVHSGIVLDAPRPMAELPGWRDGRVSVQDLAAQYCPAVLDLAAGQRVLDACAAPGNKTAAMLEAQPGLAEMVAVDVDPARVETLGKTLARLGLAARTHAGDAAEPRSWWDGEAFDRILLDAPCTGTGVIRRHPDIKLLRRADDVAALVARQAALLDALWPLLRRGGKLVYATCSALHAENDSQVLDFLERHGDARAEPPDLDCGRACKAGHQILAGECGMDGFYYARIHKL